jgi:predicted nucleotidyltransferase
MAYSTDDALKIAKAFLRKALRRHEIVQAYLFGSYAGGLQKEHSDIDLAIVLGETVVSPERYLDEAFEIYHEAQECNSLLEVICFRQKEFEENGASIVGRIKKEGIAVEVG